MLLILKEQAKKVCEHHSSDDLPVADKTLVTLLPTNFILHSTLEKVNSEIVGKQPYEIVNVGDFAPVDRKKQYMYIQLLKSGLSKPCVLCTYSVGGPAGNYHFIWCLLPQVMMAAAVRENQHLISKIQTNAPAYHHRYLRKQFS